MPYVTKSVFHFCLNAPLEKEGICGTNVNNLNGRMPLSSSFCSLLPASTQLSLHSFHPTFSSFLPPNSVFILSTKLCRHSLLQTFVSFSLLAAILLFPHSWPSFFVTDDDHMPLAILISHHAFYVLTCKKQTNNFFKLWYKLQPK